MCHQNEGNRELVIGEFDRVVANIVAQLHNRIGQKHCLQAPVTQLFSFHLRIRSSPVRTLSFNLIS